MDSTLPLDCVVVGAGAAGLSAALVLGRARRTTLVVDAGQQSNLPAHGVGGLLGHDGRPPSALYALGRDELAKYPSVRVVDGAVAGGAREDDGTFVLTLEDGTTARARHVLLATGMRYAFPDLPGVAERWGGTVFHCPFCHGWEVRERPLGVLDDGAPGVHRATLLRAWSDDVTLLTNGPSALTEDERATLTAAGVAVDERPVTGLRGPGAELDAVVFADGHTRACGGLLVPVTLHQRDDLHAQLGAATLETPLSPEALDVDGFLRTTVPGLLGAGDVSGEMPSVANAVAAGAKAAAAIVGGFAHAREPDGATMGA